MSKAEWYFVNFWNQKFSWLPNSYYLYSSLWYPIKPRIKTPLFSHCFPEKIGKHGIRNRIYQGCTHPFSSSRTAHFLFLVPPCHLHFLWQRVQVWPCPKGWYRHLSWWKEIHDIQKLKVATWKKDCVVSGGNLWFHTIGKIWHMDSREIVVAIKKCEIIVKNQGLLILFYRKYLTL